LASLRRGGLRNETLRGCLGRVSQLDAPDRLKQPVSKRGDFVQAVHLYGLCRPLHNLTARHPGPGEPPLVFTHPSSPNRLPI
jgi:hypothetical protein